MSRVLKNILYIVAVVLAAFLITQFVGMRAVVDGSSMEPALSDGDNLIIDKMTYRFRDPARYDIVICPGIEEGAIYIKRIIGLPGETIGISDGKVTINGKLLQDDHYGLDDEIVQSEEKMGMLYPGSYTLDEDEYFLMGDNRNNSRDSRDPMLGPVLRKKIIGRVWIRIWPPGKFGSLNR